MRKSLAITGVRTIFQIDKPIVVFEVAGHEAIVRNPKQALIDLQNSGRALEINTREFDGGVENLSGVTKTVFTQALLDCIGATITGEISLTKAGEKYTPNETHPVFTDKNHPFFNKIKLGETLIAEKDSVWVEGFLSIPLTESEKMRRDVAGNISKAMMAMYGLGTPVAQPRVVNAVSDTEYLEQEGLIPTATQEEAFGKK